MDQLQCLPEPLIPANGFSCRTACSPWRDFAERRHHELVVVDGDVGVLEVRRHLELARRDLVVSGDDRNAELVQLRLDFGDAGLHALGNATEVMVFELLAARRRGAQERATAHHQVGAKREVVAVDEEVFLLRSERRVDADDAVVA